MKKVTKFEEESSLQLQTSKNTTERFVAFLDIMGFKDRVHVLTTPHYLHN